MIKFVADTALTNKWRKINDLPLSSHFSSFLCIFPPSLFCFFIFCKRYHSCWLYHEFRNVCGDLLTSFLPSSYAYFAPNLTVVILINLKSCGFTLLMGAGVVTCAFVPVCTFEGSSPSVPPVRMLCQTCHSSSTYVVHVFYFWPKKGFWCERLLCLFPHSC